MNLNSNFITDILKTFTEPFDIEENYVDVMGIGVIAVVVILVSIGLVQGLNCTMPMVDLGLKSVQCQFGMITSKKGFPDVIIFLFKHFFPA